MKPRPEAAIREDIAKLPVGHPRLNALMQELAAVTATAEQAPPKPGTGPESEE